MKRVSSMDKEKNEGRGRRNEQVDDVEEEKDLSDEERPAELHGEEDSPSSH